MAEEDRGKKSYNNPYAEEHFAPEDTEEKRGFKELGVRCLLSVQELEAAGSSGARGWAE